MFASFCIVLYLYPQYKKEANILVYLTSTWINIWSIICICGVCYNCRQWCRRYIKTMYWLFRKSKWINWWSSYMYLKSTYFERSQKLQQSDFGDTWTIACCWNQSFISVMTVTAQWMVHQSFFVLLENDGMLIPASHYHINRKERHMATSKKREIKMFYNVLGLNRRMSHGIWKSLVRHGLAFPNALI